MRPAGGWSLDKTAFALTYKATSHADAFMHRWLDVTGADYDGGKGSLAPLFDTLSRADSKGRCTKCHGVEQQADGTRAVNWHAQEVRKGAKFTFFSHQPHLLFVRANNVVADGGTAGNEGCVSCHSLAPATDAKDYMKAFVDEYNQVQTDPHTYLSNFQPMTKAHCAQCHNSDSAGSSCTLCHKYHAGEHSPVKAPKQEAVDEPVAVEAD